MSNFNLLENSELHNNSNSALPNHNKETPTIPHIQVIPAKRPAESWVWSFVQKRSRCCQILVEDDNGIKHRCEWSCKNKTSTTSIANHLRTKHRIIEGKAEESEIILLDSESKVENQDPL